MSSRDIQKRRVWEARLGRYRASGLSVARFCREEQVSVHTFYYWTKRLNTNSAPTASRGGRASLAQRPAEAAGKAEGTVVRFCGKAGWEVAVPAECLGAIRCLAECLAETGARRGEAFQEVVVKS